MDNITPRERLKDIENQVEAVSQIYAERFGIERSSSWFMLKLQEEVGELVQSFLVMTGQARTKDITAEQSQNNFRDELADVLCQTLLIAHHHNIDIEQAIAAKWLK